MDDTGFHLLVIEDTPEDIQLLLAALTRIKLNCRVIHLVDGAEALAFIGREGENFEAAEPDLVLLDLGLPKASGIDVLRALRESAHLRHVPVIIMSSLPSWPVRGPLEELGAEMYWTKPTDADGFDDLADNIRAIAAGFPANR